MSIRRTLAVSEPNTLPILELDLPVSTVRQIAVGGLALALTLLAAFGWMTFQAGQPDAIARIQFEYGSRLVSVEGSSLRPASEALHSAAASTIW